MSNFLTSLIEKASQNERVQNAICSKYGYAPEADPKMASDERSVGTTKEEFTQLKLGEILADPEAELEDIVNAYEKETAIKDAEAAYELSKEKLKIE